MMQFRTEIQIPKEKNGIDHESFVVLFGSCFSEHLEKKLSYYQFEHYANPFGILFHPLAIERAITHCAENREYTMQDLYPFEGQWLSLNHHGKFNGPDPEQVLHHIQGEVKKGHEALKKATHLIITLGTSWIYRWKEDLQPVANCHKIPQKHFSKELLQADQITESLSRTIDTIRSCNKAVSILFAVSPVRHLKDGFVENTRSKSLLHQAVHQVLQRGEGLHYFPSYEILMDDLRDYRFYSNDLLHPSEMAVDYVWEKFAGSWVSEKSRELLQEIGQIRKALAHKPFHGDSEQHKKFEAKIEERITSLRKKLPGIDFKKKGSD